jgi:hypothetical protein
MALTQDLKTLTRLYEVAVRAALLNPPHTADWLLGSIGLHLDSNLTNGGYYCTPVNTSAFAWTGGDGVHFSFTHIEGKVSDQSPVVMTVPMNFGSDSINMIVGSDLVDFLRLGCVTGYAALEELSYDQDKFLTGGFVDYRKIWASHSGFDTSTEAEDAALLRLIIAEFSLTPWDNVEAHLEQLKQQYLPALQLPPDDGGNGTISTR